MANGGFGTMNRDFKLLEQLKDPEYRRGFVEGHAKDTIAFQIRQMRKAEQWEQSDLAREAFGNPKLQPMVSRYENPDYGKFSVSTLLELAAAFDVALVVRFAPFSELVEWDWNSNEATLRPAAYRRDARLRALAAQRRAPRADAVNTIAKIADLPASGEPAKATIDLGKMQPAMQAQATQGAA